MKLELLERLLDAGFNKEEIIRLARDEPNTEPTPEPVAEPNPEPVTEPTPEPVTEPTPEPVTNPEPNETEKRLSGIEKSISDLMKAIQTNNLRNDSFGEKPESLEEETDRIMKSIIRPEIEKERR